MHRRTYLSGIGTLTTAAVAGCSSLTGDDAVVDETVFGDGLYRFDAEEGDTITVSLKNEAGFMAFAAVWSQAVDETLLEMEAETDAEQSAEAPVTATYTVEVGADERAHVTVTLD